MSGEAPGPVGGAPDPVDVTVDLEIAPFAVLRAAAWPIESLDAFAAPALAALARDVLVAADAIAAARDGLADGLRDVVPLLVDGPARHDVLAARRALHRDDEPHAGLTGVADLVRPLVDGLADDLLADDTRRRRHRALVAELAAAHDERLAGERRALRRVATTPAFLTALAVGNPEVARRWRRLLDAEAAEAAAAPAPGPGAGAPSVKARVRRLEDAVLDHVCRAVGRVVPSTCWAGVAPVLPSSGPEPGLVVHPTGAEARVEPTLAAFEEVVPRLAAEATLGDGHPLRLDPKAAAGADAGALAAGDPLVRLLLDAFGPDVRTAPVLVATLGRALGGTAAVETRLGAALHDLLRRGVVVSAAVLPRGAEDAWAALDATTPLLVDPARARWSAALAELRTAAAALEAAIGDARPDDASRALGAAAAAVDGLRADTGLEPWPDAPVRIDVRLPFDTTWTAAARSRVRHAVGAVLARFAADGLAEAFRRSSVAPLATLTAHDDGPAGPTVLSLLGRPPFVARGARQVRPDADTWLGAAARLGDDDLVARAAEVATAWERAIPAGASRVRLPVAPPIDAARRPGPVGSLRFELGGDELVFRSGRPEPGFGAQGRAAWFPELDDEVRTWLADWADDDVDAAELVGADPANPNAALGRAPAARRIGPVPGALDPSRLAVHLDAGARPHLVELDAEGRPRTGRRVVPVHPHASAVGSANPLTAGLWRLSQAQGWEWIGLGVPLLPAELAAAGGTGQPALEVGDGVVLAPRRFVLDPAELRAIGGAGGADRYLAWRRVVERSGLPALVLVRTSPDPEAPERLVRTDSPMAVRGFLDAVSGRGTVDDAAPARVVARELPGDPARWPVRSPLGHHLAEVVVSWRDRAFWRTPTPTPAPATAPAAGAAGPTAGDARTTADDAPDVAWRQVMWAVPEGPDGGPAVPWPHLAATVDALVAAGATHVWYARKTGVRLRARGGAALDAVLAERSDDAVRAGAVLRATRPVYEPELARFGGPIGLALAHDLFHADTPAALHELRLPADAAPTRHRMALAVAAAGELVAPVVLDPAEVWDVWRRLDELVRSSLGAGGQAAGARAAGADEIAEILGDPMARLAPALRPLLAGARDLAAATAPRLHDAALDGTLRVGVRAWLTAVTLFAWNRRDLGLHPAELAAATAAAASLTAP